MAGEEQTALIGIPESVVELNAPSATPLHRRRRDRDGRQRANSRHAEALRRNGDGERPGAVDATCCRIMGIDPEKVDYLRMAADLGTCIPGASSSAARPSRRCIRTSR